MTAPLTGYVCARRLASPEASRAWLRVSVFMLTSITAVACAHPQAKPLLELPPLEMPSAPPRVVEAVEPQQAPIIALPDEATPSLRPRPPVAPRAEAPRPAEPAKVEQAATEAPKSEEAPKPASPTTLQTTPTQREAEVERGVRNLIARATSDLGRVDYKALNVDARNQYDTARRFATQAEDALKARNLVFANNLADKAAALAAQLLGR
ncbi:MAG: hypothetical protein ABMA15_16830 [Vicinamibacterales bacterium]